LLFNFVFLEYGIRRVHVHQDGFKLNGTHQILAFAGDVNILAESVHTIKENAEAIVVACKGIGIDVNADKIKCMIMSRDKNAGRRLIILVVPLKAWKSSNIWEQT
jgi:hypothetical protein